jgi:hypothetical protein
LIPDESIQAALAILSLLELPEPYLKAGNTGLPGFAGLVFPKAQTFPFPKSGLLLSRWAERKPGKPANPADHGKASSPDIAQTCLELLQNQG